MSLALATVAVLLSLAVALASVVAWRSAATDAGRLRQEARSLSERLEAAIRVAGQAAAQAEAASQLLLERDDDDGADEGWGPEAGEAPEGAGDEPPGTRGGRTVH